MNPHALFLPLLLTFFLLGNCSPLSSNFDPDDDVDNEISIDDDNCQLRLYRVQSYQGKAFVVKRDRKRLKGLEKSLQTIGSCCWALYAHQGFQGRPMYVGGKLALASTSRWGWRRTGIRSAKKLDSCEEDS